MTAKLEASAYLVLERDRYGMSIKELRKGKPAMRAGQVAVKIKLLIDREAFEAMIPTVTAELSIADLIEPEVVVEPPAPTDDEGDLEPA